MNRSGAGAAGNGLVAAAVHAAHRDLVLVVELVVELQEEVVRRPLEGCVHPHRAAWILRVEAQEALAGSRRAEASGGDAGPGLRDLVGRRHEDAIGRAHLGPLTLEVAEEESAVLDQGAAEGAAELLILERRLLASGLLREVVLGVHPVVVAEVIGRAMEVIRAALHHDVDGGPALDPELRPRGLLDGELLDGVGRDDGGDEADHAGSAERDVAVVAVVVRDSVHHEVVRLGALAADVDGLEAATGGALHPGHDAEQGVEVAPVEGHLVHALLVYVGVQLVRELDRGSHALDRDLFGQLAEGQAEIGLRRARDRNLHVAIQGLEPLHGDRDLVDAGGKVGQAEAAALAGDRSATELRGRAGGGHGGPGHDRAVLVGHGSENVTADLLGEQGWDQGDGEQDQKDERRDDPLHGGPPSFKNGCQMDVLPEFLLVCPRPVNWIAVKKLEFALASCGPAGAWERMRCYKVLGFSARARAGADDGSGIPAVENAPGPEGPRGLTAPERPVVRTGPWRPASSDAG